MSAKVDALFAGDEPEGPTPAPPRILRLKKLLAIAIVLDILGLPCWTSVPGAIMTLWVWMATDTDVAHIEAGTYTEAEAAELLQLRRYAAMALVLCVICANTAIMAMDSYPSTPASESLQHTSNTVFTLIYTIEACAKLLATGLQYFDSQWNVFDFCIVVSASSQSRSVPIKLV